MRKLYGSLFLRLALLVILTVLATQLFTWTIATRERRELIAKQFYSQVIDTLADLEGRLDALPPAKRDAYLLEYNRPGLTQLLPPDADRGMTFSQQPTPMEQRLTDSLTGNLDEHVAAQIYNQHGKRQLWVSVHVLGQPYWLVVPIGRFHDKVISSMMIAALLASLCAILVASAIAWRTMVPISRVVAAIRELELGRSPLPWPSMRVRWRYAPSPRGSTAW